MLKDSLAVIGLSWDLDLKRSLSEFTNANKMDFGIQLRRKCGKISQDPVIRYSLWRKRGL